MAWKDFDLFDVEKTSFDQQFHEVVLPILDFSYDRLLKLGREIDSEYEEAMSRATSHAEEIDARGWAAYKETVLDEQKLAVGAALLNVLQVGLKDTLDGMSRYFNTSHTPKPNYLGKSWLHRKQVEFLDRFGVDFKKSPVDFSSVEELVLARNAAIHSTDPTFDEYRKTIPVPRFTNGLFLVVERAALVDCFNDVNEFLKWVWAQLKEIRMKGAKGKDQ